MVKSNSKTVTKTTYVTPGQRYRRRREKRFNRLRTRGLYSGPSKSYYYKQIDDLGFISLSNSGGNGGDAPGAFNFTLDKLPQYTTFQDLYDQYCISKVVVQFIPIMNDSTWQTQSGGVYLNQNIPFLYTVIDYNDSNVPTGESEMLEYSTCKFTPVYRRQTRVLTPKIAIAAYSGTFTSYATKGKQWIDCSSPSVQHYGIKYYISVNGNTITGNASRAMYKVLVKYYIKFKNVK